MSCYLQTFFKNDKVIRYLIKRSEKITDSNSFKYRMLYGDIIELSINPFNFNINKILNDNFNLLYNYSITNKMIDSMKFDDFINVNKKIKILNDDYFYINTELSKSNKYKYYKDKKLIYIWFNDFSYVCKKIDYFINTEYKIISNFFIKNKDVKKHLNNSGISIKFRWFNDKFFKIKNNVIYFNTQLLFFDQKNAYFIINKILNKIFANNDIFRINECNLLLKYGEKYDMYNFYFKNNIMKYHF